jgi:glutaconate CoA-transferase subunit A
MALVRALIKRGVRDLHLITVPSGGLAVDMLIGAGCVRSLETSEVMLGEGGFAPHFARTVQEGVVGIQDST